MLENRIRRLFTALVIIQAIHSAEEYVGRLWEVLPLAEYLTGLLADNHETGFLIGNISLFIIGLGCIVIVRLSEIKNASAFIWFWIILELFNGAGHMLWSLFQLHYVPGVATAPLLFLVAFMLGRELLNLESKNGSSI